MELMLLNAGMETTRTIIEALEREEIGVEPTNLKELLSALETKRLSLRIEAAQKEGRGDVRASLQNVLQDEETGGAALGVAPMDTKQAIIQLQTGEVLDPKELDAFLQGKAMEIRGRMQRQLQGAQSGEMAMAA